MMCLASSLCKEELCGSVEVTREIFTDFHLQFGFFMWLQSLCNSLASGCCYISSSRTTMSLELQAKLKSLGTAHVGTLQRLNGSWLFSRIIWTHHWSVGFVSMGFHLHHISPNVQNPKMMGWLGWRLAYDEQDETHWWKVKFLEILGMDLEWG